MSVKLTNNAETKLSAAITPDNTVIAVADGNVFPLLAADEWFPVTIEDVFGNMEIVHVTARNGNALTVIRGMEGASPKAWGINTFISLRLTAAVIADLLSKTSGTITGNLTVGGTLQAGAIKSYADGMEVGETWIDANGDINGEAWQEWHVSGWLKQAINTRIEARATAIATQIVNQAINELKANQLWIHPYIL